MFDILIHYIYVHQRSCIFSYKIPFLHTYSSMIHSKSEHGTNNYTPFIELIFGIDCTHLIALYQNLPILMRKHCLFLAQQQINKIYLLFPLMCTHTFPFICDHSLIPSFQNRQAFLLLHNQCCCLPFLFIISYYCVSLLLSYSTMTKRKL